MTQLETSEHTTVTAWVSKRDRLLELAQREERSLSQLVWRALRRELERETREARS